MKPKTQLDTPNQRLLYEYLSKLSLLLFKQFYCLFVHYWTNYKCFISQQNLFNLWCELNQCCHDSDESFPDQYDDHEVMKSFCMTYPYYFIDKLPIPLIADLFAQYPLIVSTIDEMRKEFIAGTNDTETIARFLNGELTKEK